MWGVAPVSLNEVYETFARWAISDVLCLDAGACVDVVSGAIVCSRYLEGQIPRLPWSINPLSDETNDIVRALVNLNRQGV